MLCGCEGDAFSLQIMLHVSRCLFEDTTKLEVIIDKVMQKSMELIPCQQSTVLLLDTDSDAEVCRLCAGV